MDDQHPTQILSSLCLEYSYKKVLRYINHFRKYLRKLQNLPVPYSASLRSKVHELEYELEFCESMALSRDPDLFTWFDVNMLDDVCVSIEFDRMHRKCMDSTPYSASFD